MNQYPASNFHDLNLDWLLQQMKNCLAEWEETKTDWNNLEADNTEFKAYVTNYFDNLDVSDEISAKIDELVEDGTLLEIITDDPTGEGSALSDAVGGWISTHLHPEPTDVMIDDSLTVSGAAADAKAAGDRITALENANHDITYFTDNIIWDDGYFYFWNSGVKTASGSYSCFSAEIENGAVAVHVKTMTAGIAGICFFDDDDTYITGSGIKNNGEGNSFSQAIKIPAGAKYIGVSCIITEKSNASISTNVKQELSVVIDDVNNKITFPSYYIIQNLTMNQGIVNTSGSVYNPGGDYNGRYITAHLSKGDKIKASGYSFNGTYPLIVTVYDDTTKEYYYNDTSTAYTDQLLTMPKDGTIYINGVNPLSLPVLKKEITLTQDEINSIILNGTTDTAPLKATYKNGKLMIKKRKSDSLSVCVVFANVGGNSLFNFYSIHNVTEENSDVMNDSFESNGTEISAGSTDWFGPYVVQAVNDADGDVPEGNNYFTGGNHRSNNTGVGGGVTAVQNSLAILIDGRTPVNGMVYNAFEIVAKWSNDVQGNNTSKSTGNGRAILTENWSMKINADGIFCENDFVAKEAITLKTYYGLQVYFPSSNILMKGGTTRTSIAMGSAGNSGNKTCREANVYSANFSVELDVDALDLGLFDNTTHSFVMTSANKLYCYAVSQNISIAQGEHYYLSGCYKIN